MNNSDSQLNPTLHPGTDVYGVIGNPVAHSKSPIIHAQFANQAGQNIYYGKLFSEVEQFTETVNTFFARGGRGLNVTVPFKTQAYQLCTHLTERAKAAGVVNILWKKGNQYYGDNSDGVGLVRDIEQQIFPIAHKNILILGAGGAVQGVILPFLEKKPAHIWIANRTLEKAQMIVKRFTEDANNSSVKLQALASTHIQQIQEPIHLIINGTSTGLHGTSPLTQEQVNHIATLKSANQSDNIQMAYDMVYGKDTDFMLQMRLANIPVIDGLGMLVEQAAVAFELWRNIAGQGRLNTAQVLEKLRHS
jgi:shikimate dehydrogenase